MAYFHIDRMQLYLQKTLGFSNIVHRAIPVNLHTTPDDNSFYSPPTGSLNFGDGMVNDAQDGDVISHEYGHAIQDSQVPGIRRDHEGGTIGEGFGDYWEAAMSANEGNADKFNTCFAEWDTSAVPLHRQPIAVPAPGRLAVDGRAGRAGVRRPRDPLRRDRRGRTCCGRCASSWAARPPTASSSSLSSATRPSQGSGTRRSRSCSPTRKDERRSQPDVPSQLACRARVPVAGGARRPARRGRAARVPRTGDGRGGSRTPTSATSSPSSSPLEPASSSSCTRAAPSSISCSIRLGRPRSRAAARSPARPPPRAIPTSRSRRLRRAPTTSSWRRTRVTGTTPSRASPTPTVTVRRMPRTTVPRSRIPLRRTGTRTARATPATVPPGLRSPGSPSVGTSSRSPATCCREARARPRGSSRCAAPGRWSRARTAAAAREAAGRSRSYAYPQGCTERCRCARS